MSCRDKGITTVITFATIGDDRTRLGKKLNDTLGNPLTRNLHQSLGSTTPMKGGFLGGFHLLGCEDHGNGKDYSRRGAEFAERNRAKSFISTISPTIFTLCASEPLRETFLNSGARKSFATKAQHP